jgi:hypothetical protein
MKNVTSKSMSYDVKNKNKNGLPLNEEFES